MRGRYIQQSNIIHPSLSIFSIRSTKDSHTKNPIIPVPNPYFVSWIILHYKKLQEQSINRTTHTISSTRQNICARQSHWSRRHILAGILCQCIHWHDEVNGSDYLLLIRGIDLGSKFRTMYRVPHGLTLFINLVNPKHVSPGLESRGLFTQSVSGSVSVNAWTVVTLALSLENGCQTHSNQR